MAKKKEKTRSSRIETLLAGDIVAGLRKQHGESIIIRASDFKVQECNRIPTGIFDLDYALGGGFPVGRFSTLYGPKSAGKTSVFLKGIANFQKMCVNCYTFMGPPDGTCKCGDYKEPVIVYLDVEGALDLPWVKKLGVDLENILIQIPEYAEQALDIGEALLRSGEVDLLVLDSIAFLTPQKEIENSVDKAGMGNQAQIIGRGVRKFLMACNAMATAGRRPTIWYTNQIRMSLGMFVGNPEVQPGGHAHGFAAAVEVRVQDGNKYEMDEKTGKPLSTLKKFRVTKNKTSGAKMEGEYRMTVTDNGVRKVGDIEDETSLMSWGEKTGTITKHGANGYKCLERDFRLKGDLERELVQNPEFKQQLKDTLMPLLLAM